MVFDIDYRLAPPPRWHDAPGDVKCAVGWVKENADRYGVDPDRVVVMGGSAGGHLALLVAYAAEEPDLLPPSCQAPDTRVAAVVALYPATDLIGLYNEELPWWQPDMGIPDALRGFTGGIPNAFPEPYRIASPVSHVCPDAPQRCCSTATATDWSRSKNPGASPESSSRRACLIAYSSYLTPSTTSMASTGAAGAPRSSGPFSTSF